ADQFGENVNRIWRQPAQGRIPLNGPVRERTTTPSSLARALSNKVLDLDPDPLVPVRLAAQFLLVRGPVCLPLPPTWSRFVSMRRHSSPPWGEPRGAAIPRSRTRTQH